MIRSIRNLNVTKIICLIAAAGLAGCASTAKNIESGETLEKAASVATDTIVFGKFRLVRNGEEIRLGEGIFANSATLELQRSGSNGKIVGEVGRDGEFAWALEPGSYRMSSIGFSFRGEKIESPTSFSFAVSSDHPASYVGTIALEATFDSGYHGTSGTVDRITVRNDCETECEQRLMELGLPAGAATASLFHWEGRVASTN